MNENINLDYEEIKKFEALTLDPGVFDAAIAAIFQFFFIVLMVVFPPPVFVIKETNFILVIAFFCLLTVPILIILIIDLVINFKEIKTRKKETEIKNYRLISALSFYTIPLLFLFYLPTNILEFYLWIITAFALYIGFFKFPLIKYSIQSFNFPSNKLYFNRKVVRNIIPSVFFWG